MQAQQNRNSERSGWRGYLGLLVSLVLVWTTGGLGAMASVQAPEFYRELQQPNWAPPASWFGPVWTVLYVMMAVSLWLWWRKVGYRDSAMLYWCFGLQLVANAGWSWLFFVWRSGGWAMLDIVLLWLLIGLCVKLMWDRGRMAALLLLPYWAWVSFAMVLNGVLWRSNLEILSGTP